tara:strand:+ start:303 stop:884 length:582 start_codon:yes stop_codon:yes gene_type:complete
MASPNERNKSAKKTKNEPKLTTSQKTPKPKAKDLKGLQKDVKEYAKDRVGDSPKVKGEGSMAKIKAMAKKLSPAARVGARFLGPLGIVYTAVELTDATENALRSIRSKQIQKAKKKARTGSPPNPASGRLRGSPGKAVPRSSKDSTKKQEKKNYNVGVSRGGVSFKEAFRHFRNKGNKTFTWNGKKYTTELKK